MDERRSGELEERRDDQRSDELAGADAHEAVGGVTRVVVRKVARLPTGETRVLGESVIEEIPDGAPDWHERFSAARQVAYDRAIDVQISRLRRKLDDSAGDLIRTVRSEGYMFTAKVTRSA